MGRPCLQFRLLHLLIWLKDYDEVQYREAGGCTLELGPLNSASFLHVVTISHRRMRCYHYMSSLLSQRVTWPLYAADVPSYSEKYTLARLLLTQQRERCSTYALENIFRRNPVQNSARLPITLTENILGIPQGERRKSTLKYATTASFQIPTYSSHTSFSHLV